MIKYIPTIWEKIFFTKKAHYWNIVDNNKLSELRPVEWVIVWINKFKTLYWNDGYKYTIECKHSIDYIKNIHTVYPDKESYYIWIANIIAQYDKNFVDKLYVSIRNYFSK